MANILHTIVSIKKGDIITHKCSKGIFTYKVIKTNEIEAVNILIEHLPLEEGKEDWE